jgi:hypothetical protein
MSGHEADTERLGRGGELILLVLVHDDGSGEAAL